MNTFVIGDIHGRRAQLETLLALLPRDELRDSLVFLGDLVDRGAEAPGGVETVRQMVEANPQRVICLRGNHEQMLLNFLDEGSYVWLSPMTGGEFTFEQYMGHPLQFSGADDLEQRRLEFNAVIPTAHVEFLRSLPSWYEDDYAFYVHAGLDRAKHPRETDNYFLMWSRDREFFTNYHGKPCIVGHTPTQFLPLRGRLGRHGIYIYHSAVGIDTGYDYHSPLTCLQLPDMHVYQAYADGHTEKHHITTLLPEALRALKPQAEIHKSLTA